jgi:hypothetical protein
LEVPEAWRTQAGVKLWQQGSTSHQHNPVHLISPNTGVVASAQMLSTVLLELPCARRWMRVAAPSLLAQALLEAAPMQT